MIASPRAGELTLRGDIEFGAGDEFAKALDELGSVDELTLRINSHGGSVFEAMAMLYALTTHPARKVVIIEGIAASAASYLATGADEIRIFEPAMLMVHFASTGTIGNKRDMREVADLLDKIDGQIANLYAARTGTNPRDWLQAMGEETWFTSSELSAIGLATVIPAKGVGEPTARDGRRLRNSRTSRQSAIVNSLLSSSPRRKPRLNQSVSQHLEALARRAAEVAHDELVGARNANRESIVRNADNRTHATRYLKWS